MTRRLSPVELAPGNVLSAHRANTIGSTRCSNPRSSWRAYLPADFRAPDPEDGLIYSETQWDLFLSACQYRALREMGTEPAFSSVLVEERRRGVYVCAACDLPLFTSAMKYDSGRGWPAFFTCIPDSLARHRMPGRSSFVVGYHCVRCDGHQGRIFSDGPAPGYRQWRNNGVALRFMSVDGELCWDAPV